MNVLLAGIAAGVLLRAVVIGRLWYTDSLRDVSDCDDGGSTG